VLRVVAAQLRHRIGRSSALLLGILVAVTSFTILTGTTEVSRLETVGSVEENFRSAYDILVRPSGSTSQLENERGLVRNNFLSGLAGGISLAQYEEIKAIGTVDVAAPIAVLGYQSQRVERSVPLEPYLDRSSTRQVFRTRTMLRTDRGLSEIPGTVGYSYVTSRPLTDREVPTPAAEAEADNSVSYFQPYEELENGEQIEVCPPETGSGGPFDRSQAMFECFSSIDDRELSRQIPERFPPEGIVSAWWPVTFLLAAIDPAQETQLAGLDEAVVEGRYLRSSDEPVRTDSTIDVPFLLSSEHVIDEQLEVVVERLPAHAAREMTAELDARALEARLSAIPGVEVDRLTIDGARAGADIAEGFAARSDWFQPLESRWSVGPVAYQQLEAARLRPQEVEVADESWSSGEGPLTRGNVPWSAADVGYREPRLHDARWFIHLQGRTPAVKAVGVFDPARLPAWSELSALPMETYRPPDAVGWDDRSRQLLGDRSLLPSSSPSSYLASPPLMLTTLSSLGVLTNPEHFSGTDRERPISAVRVRVADVTEPDAASRERVRLVAEEIVERTGLEVDITIGSSPTPMRVDLGEGEFGRPALSLREQWVKKGVAVAILDALDRKSTVLFGLILVVCSLVMANAAAAATRARRAELGTLACLGWSSRALYGAVIGELVLIGLVAGALAGLLAPGVAALFAIDVPASRVWMPVGASLILAVLAGLLPAGRAARARPASAVQPAALAVRSTPQPRRLIGLAVTNLLRVPGRTLLGAFSLAVGVCALTVVLAATFAFHEVLVGSLLGDATSIQVRGVDYVAVMAVLALGAFAVGDVLYLNVQERATEFAALQATGWSRPAVARLVLYEGLVVGMFGSVVGAALGLGSAALFAGGITAELWLTATAAVVAGTALAAVAALPPSRLPSRLPIATLLAEE
jgi:ABC-type lipoprotein release transport system permease subunit